MPDTLELAVQLRARDDAALRSLLASRSVAADAKAADFFDLAELLLAPRSIRLAMQRLDRATLAVIALAAEQPDDLEGIGRRLREHSPSIAAIAPDISSRARHAVDLLLLRQTDAGLAAFEPVAAIVRASGSPDEILPDTDSLLSTPAPAVHETAELPHGDPDLAASESAWGAAGAVAELLLELQGHPARELGRGGVAAPDLKRLALVMHVEIGAVSAHLELASRAGLVSNEPMGWTPTATADAWLMSPAQERWRVLADAWLDALSSQVRDTLSRVPDASWGHELVRYAEWLYPAGESWIHNAVERVEAQASVLGVTTRGRLSPAGRAVLSEGASAAAAELTRFFPEEVDRVYLQHDLTVIAPGPLEPALDLRLRTMADLESRAQASTYRFTMESTNRALGAGETAESMLAFLSELSLTGIPQPIGYLVTQAAERYGAVRVGTIGESDPGATDAGAQSYVRSDDASIIGQLAVDQALGPLNLRQTGRHRLVSRFDYEVVFWTLRDAHYPVAAESPDGDLVGLKRRRASRAAPPSRVSSYDDLIARLRSTSEASSADGGGQAWIARQLDAAIRAKSTVTVMVQVPGSGPVALTLEPTGIGGGRLRGRDRTADIERTLPLSSIIELRA